MRALDVLLCIKRLREYTNGATFEQFEGDSMRVDACARNLEIICEAITEMDNQNSAVFGRYPELDLPAAKGMRIILAHKYHRIDADRLWQTIQIRLDTLESVFTDLLKYLT